MVQTRQMIKDNQTGDDDNDDSAFSRPTKTLNLCSALDLYKVNSDVDEADLVPGRGAEGLANTFSP